jgi:uncharacterized protein
MENVMQHTVNWFDIPVADMARAMKFYQTLTGRALRREAFGAPGEEMAVFEAPDSQGVSGALVHSSHAKPAAHGTLVYLNAGSSIQACLDRVNAAGGSIAVGKTTLPQDMGFFAHIIDTEGNKVGLHSEATAP